MQSPLPDVSPSFDGFENDDKDMTDSDYFFVLSFPNPDDDSYAKLYKEEKEVTRDSMCWW